MNGNSVLLCTFKHNGKRVKRKICTLRACNIGGIWQTLETHYCDASALSEELCSILSALYAIRNSSFTPSGDDEEDEKPPF